jgi:predicted Rossmann fold nucleotide-binding protein DprA/Smf involved in DNA uptake
VSDTLRGEGGKRRGKHAASALRHTIERDNTTYPKNMLDRILDVAPYALYAIGDAAILRSRPVGLMCSIQCPGSIIVKTLDAAHVLRNQGVATIGGFHTPMERQCLDILFRGPQPVVICPPKGLSYLRLGQAARQALKDRRLLLLSPFDKSVRRSTAAQARRRNDLVATLSDVLWVPYASPGGNTWDTVQRALARGQSVITLRDENNLRLVEMGALAVDADEIATVVSTTLVEHESDGGPESPGGGSPGGVQ